MYMKLKYKLAKSVVHLIRGQWHLFFEPKSLNWIITDSTGASICEALVSAKDFKKIVLETAAKINFPPNEIAFEMRRFLKALLRTGIAVKVGKERTGKACSPQTSCSFKPKLSSLYLHLTARCNLNCAYCYNLALRKQKSWGNDLPLPLAMKTLSQAKEMGIKTLFLTGGEPLLHPNALEIAEAGHNFGFYVVLLTNGLLVDEHVAEKLARYCDEIVVSLDSANPALHDLHRGRGTHERTVQAIKHLKAAGARVVVTGVITRYNQYEPYKDFENFALKIGAERAIRQLYVLQGDQRDLILSPDVNALLKNFEEALEKAVIHPEKLEGEIDTFWRDRCGAAFGVIAVSSNGGVYPCQGLMGPEFEAGKITKASLAEIFKNSKILAQIRAITVANIPGCHTCPFRHLCGGGCRALAYNVYHSLTAPIPKEYCAFNRLLAERKLWVAALKVGSADDPHLGLVQAGAT